MIYLRIGNKNGGSPVHGRFSQQRDRWNGLPHFFVVGRLTGFLCFWPQTVAETVPRNKRVIPWESGPPYTAFLMQSFFLPEMGAPVRKKVCAIPWTKTGHF